VVLGGGGATIPVWTDVLTAVTGVPAARRRSGEAASAGAALIAARALGIEIYLDRLDPVELRLSPDASAVEAYRQLRLRADAAAAAMIELG
jgi:sugar (pentulose or hexulose) kinase